LTSISELSPAEASALGPLLQRLSAALEATTGATKCYILFFAEAPGFEHLHIHIVPRLKDLPPERIGPGVIAYLNEPSERWIPATEMDGISGRIKEAMERQRKEQT
jgi:diadenosine tetraphosphate (Ap4A) HIT family hydrolase